MRDASTRKTSFNAFAPQVIAAMSSDLTSKFSFEWSRSDVVPHFTVLDALNAMPPALRDARRLPRIDHELFSQIVNEVIDLIRWRWIHKRETLRPEGATVVSQRPPEPLDTILDVPKIQSPNTGMFDESTDDCSKALLIMKNALDIGSAVDPSLPIYIRDWFKQSILRVDGPMSDVPAQWRLSGSPLANFVAKSGYNSGPYTHYFMLIATFASNADIEFSGVYNEAWLQSKLVALTQAVYQCFYLEPLAVYPPPFKVHPLIEYLPGLPNIARKYVIPANATYNAGKGAATPFNILSKCGTGPCASEVQSLLSDPVIEFIIRALLVRKVSTEIAAYWQCLSYLAFVQECLDLSLDQYQEITGSGNTFGLKAGGTLTNPNANFTEGTHSPPRLAQRRSAPSVAHA